MIILPRQAWDKQEHSKKSAVFLQLATPREIDSAPLTGERTAKCMAAMAPSISSMQKMAIGALEAMDNANRLQQMEKEKEEMRERESSLKQQLAEAEGEKARREAELQQMMHREKEMQVRACLICSYQGRIGHS
jgi:cell division protein ZapA (FtsZ GTPase activity inhibitor)